MKPMMRYRLFLLSLLLVFSLLTGCSSQSAERPGTQEEREPAHRMELQYAEQFT